MTVVKRNKRAKPDPELLKLADSLLANYRKPKEVTAACAESLQRMPALKQS